VMIQIQRWWLGWLLRIAWMPRLPVKCRCRRRRRERGTVMVEYVVLLTTVAIGLTIAVVGLGVPLVRMYVGQTEQLSLPFP
jgi:Flp pilus assembly pilin Flp